MHFAYQNDDGTYMKKDKALLRLLSNPRVIAAHYSPSISRSFTESMSEARHQAARTIPAPVNIAWPRLLNEWTVVGVASGILLVLVASLSLQIRDEWGELGRLRAMQSSITTEITHWQGVVTQHADYRDGYFRLALLHYQLGDVTQASEYVEKSLALDPNFEAGKSFKEKLVEE